MQLCCKLANLICILTPPFDVIESTFILFCVKVKTSNFYNLQRLHWQMKLMPTNLDLTFYFKLTFSTTWHSIKCTSNLSSIPWMNDSAVHTLIRCLAKSSQLLLIECLCLWAEQRSKLIKSWKLDMQCTCNMCMYATGNKFTCMWNNQSKGEILVFNARNKKGWTRWAHSSLSLDRFEFNIFNVKKTCLTGFLSFQCCTALHPMLMTMSPMYSNCFQRNFTNDHWPHLWMWKNETDDKHFQNNFIQRCEF